MNLKDPLFYSRFSDLQLLAIYRVAKTRLRVFFADPVTMIVLRNEVIRRGYLQECEQQTKKRNLRR